MDRIDMGWIFGWVEVNSANKVCSHLHKAHSLLSIRVVILILLSVTISMSYDSS